MKNIKPAAKAMPKMKAVKSLPPKMAVAKGKKK